MKKISTNKEEILNLAILNHKQNTFQSFNRNHLQEQIQEKELMKHKNSYLSTTDWKMNQSVLRNIANDDQVVNGVLMDYKDVIMEHLPDKPAPRGRFGGAKSSDLGNYLQAEDDKISASLARFEAIQEKREQKVRSSMMWLLYDCTWHCQDCNWTPKLAKA